MTELRKWSWVSLLCAAVTIVSHAQNFETLASFRSFGYPQYAQLVQGNDGELYGTTTGNWGTVFKITTGGGLAVVCYFGESGCPDGAFPFAGLLQTADGNFYGTAWQGNASGSNTVYGAGTVFEITAAGQPITLYGFCSESKCGDGADPYAPLIQAKNGSFYGAAFDGGAKGYGTLFELSPAGKLTTLHSFDFEDGAGPVGGLIQAKNGSFYGTTLYGGANGAGTVFLITPPGDLKTLHSFGSEVDGANPYSRLVQATDGNFYGTTYSGGEHAHGTIFRMTASGKLTTLYRFCSQKKCTDGAYPYAGLIQAADGNFYGTTSKGGSNNWGTLFAFTPGGALTTLHSFCQKKNCTDGADPVGGLLQAADGNFYGTTAEGGVYENGTVFSQSLGVFPFVGTLPASGEEAKLTTEVSEFGQFGPGYLIPMSASDTLGLHPTDGHQFIKAAPGPLNPDLTCSPAPCVLPPTQASEGGSIVTDSPIVESPANAKHLLVGSFDGNCPAPSLLGFHLSTDGGSNWSRHCMPTIQRDRMYSPVDDPQVGYDLNGTAYIAGFYGAEGAGLVGFQRSSDGIHWSKAAVALRLSVGTFPYYTALTVDRSPGSPWANSVYVSGAMAMDRGRKTQVMVSHSSDKGGSWTKATLDSVQTVPMEDMLTRMAVSASGVVYTTWMRCRVPCYTARMMSSRSSDGGATWSPPQRIATVEMPPNWQLPNAQGERVYNYPVVAVDNSNGPHSGNVYVAMYTWTGSYLRVQVIHSSDGGKTWSQPVPVAAKSDIHDQFFPSVSVSSQGEVGVSWLDRRDDPANLDYQAFAAFSDDGGKTFKKNWQLTQAFSDPDTNGTMNNWMGDYTGNTWDGNTFIAAWMDSSNGIDMQEVVGGVRLK